MQCYYLFDNHSSVLEFLACGLLSVIYKKKLARDGTKKNMSIPNPDFSPDWFQK